MGGACGVDRARETSQSASHRKEPQLHIWHRASREGPRLLDLALGEKWRYALMLACWLCCEDPTPLP